MKRILVIDDDHTMAETVEEVLSLQYDVFIETNHANVLKSYQQHHPDLILVDNWVGQREARDIMAELEPHMRGNATPFVLFSGHPDVSQIAHLIKADDWLAKPFALNDLYTCINKLLN